jgi:hypothetical protein
MDLILVTTAGALTAGLGVALAWLTMQRVVDRIAVRSRRSENR